MSRSGGRLRYACAPMTPSASTFPRLQLRVALPETGIEIAVTEWPSALGDSAPIALLHHANGFCGAMWTEVAEPLSAHFRVFAVDARGHGDSSKPEGDEAYAWDDMAADLGSVGEWVRAHTGAPSIALGIGHSFGGVLTMAAAAIHPDLYERAILIDPVVLPALTPEMIAMAAENPMAGRARKRRSHWDSRDEAYAILSEKPLFENFTERSMRLYIDEGLRDAPQGGVELKCPGRVEGAIFGSSLGFDPYDYASRATVPIRLCRATRGDFRRESYKRVVELLDQGELCEIEGGHLVPMEDPAGVVAEVLAFAGISPT
jgi:pimeloyl-ACP methyl ester carboxylesterase